MPLPTSDIQPGRSMARPLVRRLETIRRWPGWRPMAAAVPAGVVALLGIAHVVAIWVGMGGYTGLANGWPIWRHDHPLYFHSALVTRSFLRDSFTTAGYDPSFMAGYAKSVVFPASSTLPELAVAAFGGSRPELAYKLYVFLSAAAYPWLLALACRLFGVRGWGVACAVGLALVYLWTDWPLNYADFGMLPYFLGIPVSLVATGCLARYLERRTVARWAVAAFLLGFAVLVHLTTAMVAAPAALVGYIASARGRDGEAPRWSFRSHLAVWSIAVVVLAMNAFWWLPGLFLSSTKGDSSFAFGHSGEDLIGRLAQIAWGEAPIEPLLLGAGLPGLIVLVGRSRIRGLTLAGFCGAGLAWGYLAGAAARLDFLQPGRHTYALYSGLAIATAAGLQEAARRLRDGTGSAAIGRLDRWFIAGALLFGLRIFGPSLVESVRVRLYAGEPFLSSRPSPRMVRVLDWVGRHVRPGERLIYEEGGKDLPGVRDPYRSGRFSGLLPWKTGVEVLGGPYLHAALDTNFTQFGEGKLFGRSDWDRDYFVRTARLYRPSAILCWSTHARGFCKANPDLVRVVEDDGTFLLARVEGFGGDTIRGRATVEARPGRLIVRDMKTDLDGSVVLRYHFVPCLRSRSSVACEPELVEPDPVPFIRLRPPAGIRDAELRMDLPMPRGSSRGGTDARAGATRP
ncbi:MAG: ArnT family glycosyltransferase [Isosphaeraceae bacterium]